ncbi:MAG: ABC transporter permease subunit [Clostridia bacterium]|nr:ABC transporter permease subunit [Clostridia bacterium]
MIKVIGFELKKLVSRIGIYILVAFMAGLLVAGIFVYEPIERDTTPKSLVGETVSAMYGNFNSNFKQEYLDKVENIALNASTYISTSANYNLSNSSKYINDLYTTFDDYCLLYSETTATSQEYETLLVGIRESLNNLNSALEDGLNPCKNTNGYYILTTNENYTKLNSTIKKTQLNFNSVTSHTFASEAYINEYRTPLKEYLNKLIYPNLSKTAERYVVGGTYHTIIISRMDEIAQKMDAEVIKVTENPNLEYSKSVKNELNALFNRYVNCAEIFAESYDSSMCVDALNTVSSKTKRTKLLGYDDVSLYEKEETALLYQYYIEHHASSYDFANSLSVTHTSNGKTNAYDFTFFIMSIFAIGVIVFAIYLSAHTISGEINNNTMRFTAIRPVKRSSLFFGKYLAIMIMSLILLLFGTITSLIAGGIMFGFDSASILTVVNGNIIFSAHPLLLIGLFVLSLFLITALYSALTMVLSSLFKSDLLAMIIGVVFYAINFIVPLFGNAGSWLRFYPFANINLFAYFGSNRLTTDSVFAKLFNNIVYHGMNIWISLIYVFGITTILLLIGRHLFKKREL